MSDDLITEKEKKEYRDVEIIEVEETHPIYGIVAKVGFFFFLFFSFYGTSLPFRERIRDVADLATSNIVNQVTGIAIFLMASFALIPKISKAIDFLFKDKILAIFILWCLLSLAWSDFAFVAFKRWFQLFTAVLAILAVFQYVKSIDDLLKFFTVILSVYVIANLITVFTVPLAKDEYGEWRGITTHKNFLGQGALMSALIFVYAIKESHSFLAKGWYWLMFIMATILVFGCASSTSILSYCIIMIIWFLYWVDSQFRKLGVGRIITILTLAGIVTLIVSSVVIMPDRVNAALGLIGEDLTFTGRTDIWKDIMIEVKKHPVLGTGYQSFWVLTNPDLGRIFNIYIWLPNQAHNGYLDILNELGIIGLVMLFILIINFFVKKRRLNYDFYWKWFFIIALIINFQESTLFKPGVLSASLFIFAYLGLFKELELQEEVESEIEFIDEETEEDFDNEYAIGKGL